ncbi:hypothetical protein AOLI_G00251580 [Acnodon oligacanthus]
MSKAGERKGHWSRRLRDSAVSRDAVAAPQGLLGGAERGEFVHTGAALNGAVEPGELVLEVEGLSVSGLPLYDVLSLVQNCRGAAIRAVFGALHPAAAHISVDAVDGTGPGL